MTPSEEMQDLLSGYYNLDWYDLNPDPWALLAEFIHFEPAKLRPLLDDLRTALTQLSTEDELRGLLDSLMCGYNPTAFGQTYRGWLTAVADRIERALADRRDR